jgi:hypothetical protein
VSAAAASFRTYLDQAHAVLEGGDAQDSERLAKAISALVRAERDVSELLTEQRAAHESDDEDSIRAELHRRLALFIAVEQAGGSDDELARIAREGRAE